jgi:hypothetical protein
MFLDFARFWCLKVDNIVHKRLNGVVSMSLVQLWELTSIQGLFQNSLDQSDMAETVIDSFL